MKPEYELEDEDEVSLVKVARMFIFGVLVSIPLMIVIVQYDKHRARKQLQKYDWFAPLITDKD